MAQRNHAYMSYEAFLDWADEDTLAEWVEGEVVMTSPASLRHQQLAGFLYTILSSYARAHGLGVVIGPPFQMKLPRSGREPDVIYVANEHRNRLRPTYLDGPADLAIELISPESAERDRVRKLDEYQEGGVSEYWLIDPDARQADYYQLDAQGRYQSVDSDADGIYHSRAVPGFRLRVAWLWQDPLPDPVRTLLQIDPAVFARYLHEQLEQEGL